MKKIITILFFPLIVIGYLYSWVIFIFYFIEDIADDLSEKRLKFVYKILNK